MARDLGMEFLGPNEGAESKLLPKGEKCLCILSQELCFKIYQFSHMDKSFTTACIALGNCVVGLEIKPGPCSGQAWTPPLNNRSPVLLV